MEKQDQPGDDQSIPVWLRSVERASQPVTPPGKGGLDAVKRLIRRAIAKAAWRGGRELVADQAAFNQSVVEALSRLASAVHVLDLRARSADRDPSTLEGLQASLRALQSDLSDLRRRVAAGTPTDGASAVPPPLVGRGTLSDIYRSFEETFRGSQALVESRLQVYRPWLRACFAGLPEPLWLDAGCGRGEWLRVLAQEGIRAQGVDGNPGMVEAARAAGLDVELGDLMAHLRGRASASLDGFSAFHVIEHIPPEALIELLQEGLRVVRPNGMLILETPNPENLQVGAHSFYLDPTHRSPVPPALLEFLAKEVGWVDVELLRLHPDETDFNNFRRAWRGHSAMQRAAGLLFGPRDYALLARRP